MSAPIDEKESTVELKVADSDSPELVEAGPAEDFSPESEPASEPERAQPPEGLPNFGPEFEATGFIGKDAYGELYSVRNVRMNAEMCARLIPSDKFDSEESRKAFLRFCRRYLTVTHPAMAALYSFHDEPIGVWFTMDPIAGTSLESWIDNGEFRSSSKIADIFEQLAECIDALHQVGIRFGAMTPSGIFIQETAHGHKILLRDWWAYALLQAQEGKTAPSVMAYASPEQLQGEGKLDERADIYTFGVMLFEAMTGHTPFKHNDPLKLAIKILNDEAPKVDGTLAGTPFATIAATCLRKNSQDRYDSVKHLREDLRAAARGAALPFRRSMTKKNKQGSTTKAVVIMCAISMFGLIGLSNLVGATLRDMNDISPPAGQGFTLPPEEDLDSQAFDEESRGNYDAAASLWQSQLDTRPNDPWVLTNLGRVLGLNHEHDEAMRILTRAASLDPLSGGAYFEMAKLQTSLGENPQALTNLKLALEKEPDNWEILNQLAFTYSQSGQFDNAIAAAKKALALDPTNFQAQFNLGVAYYGAEKFSDAVKTFKSALDIEDNTPSLWTNLALSYLKTGNKTAALAAAQQAVILDPHDIQYARNVAHIYAVMGNLQKAEQTYRQALNLDRFDSGTWAGLADTYRKMGRIADAKDAESRIHE